jgi:peptide/nickel transport system ATP-binding protein
MPDPRPVLRVDGLRVETISGADIVDQVAFDVASGEVLALVGESGCGKTSTALALFSYVRPGTRIAAGSVVLDGTDLLQLSSSIRRQTCGSQITYVPQDPNTSLNPRHRIDAQISEVLTAHGTDKAAATAITAEIARRVGLDDPALLRRYPFELSGGQQQRVAIAMALACRPKVVVLDEPTTGLDVNTQARVLDLLKELARTSGAAFVYVTHDLAVVDAIANHVAVMYSGRIVEAGPRAQVLYHPAHPYTAMLVESVPRLSVRRQLTGIAGTALAPGSRPPGCFFAPRCPAASERCSVTFPPISHVDDNHLVRCWHAQPAAGFTNKLRDALTPSSAAAPLVAVEGLVASYGPKQARKTVVRDVSFALARGECLAVVGESGSGKSTIGRCIAGLHQPDGGTIRLNDGVLAPTATARRQEQRQAIQIIFQNPERSLNPNETVDIAIQRPLRLFGVADYAARRQQAAALLGQVRLPGKMLDRYPRELSGGEKQRVAIARALAAHPSVLLCDEITSSLDVSTQAAIVALLEELKAGGLALLFITHNLALVHSIADRILVLESGEIRELGVASEVIGHPSHRYTKTLMSAAPELGRGSQASPFLRLVPNDRIEVPR